MDKGAHFHRCDFQVHTPRDINWKGDKFGVDQQSIGTLTEKQKKEISY